MVQISPQLIINKLVCDQKQVANDMRMLMSMNVFYFMPDFPSLLQLFFWQKQDLHPEYPELHKFVKFWNENIEGKIHSVEIMVNSADQERIYKFLDAEITIN